MDHFQAERNHYSSCNVIALVQVKLLLLISMTAIYCLYNLAYLVSQLQFLFTFDHFNFDSRLPMCIFFQSESLSQSGLEKKNWIQ